MAKAILFTHLEGDEECFTSRFPSICTFVFCQVFHMQAQVQNFYFSKFTFLYDRNYTGSQEGKRDNFPVPK